MKGIIYNNEQDALSLTNEIDTAFSFAFKGSTTTYTHVIKHPDREEWAVILDMEDVTTFSVAYPEQFTSLSKGVEDIEDLDSTWIEIIEL